MNQQLRLLLPGYCVPDHRDDSVYTYFVHKNLHETTVYSLGQKYLDKTERNLQIFHDVGMLCKVNLQKISAIFLATSSEAKLHEKKV